MSDKNQTTIPLIKMSKTVTSKVDLCNSIIRLHLAFNNKKLSDTCITVLSYFIVYGISLETKKLIVSSLICKNLGNLKTIMAFLKREGYIYKDEFNRKSYVSKQLNIPINNGTAFYLKIDLK